MPSTFRRAMLGALVATTVALTAACSSSSNGGGGTGDSNTITFMAAAYSDKTQGYWQGVISSFEQSHPSEKVSLSVVSWDDYDQKVATLLANHQQPDLLNYNTWASYAAAGLLYPARDIVSPAVLNDFLPAFSGGDRYQGTQYALPFIASARALYYNKKIFAAAGITAPPRTWSDFEADALKIKKAGDIGYALPLGTEEAQGELSMWIFNGGGGWQTGGRWSINSPANLAAVEFLNRLANTDKVTEDNPGTTNRTDGAWQLFAQGRAGMVYGFPGTFGQILTKAGMAASDYGVAPAPTSTAAQPPATLGVQDVLMGFNKGDGGHQRVMRDFLDYLYQPRNYQKFLAQEGFLPTNQSGSTALKSDPVLGPYISLLPNAEFEPTDDKAWTKVADITKQTIGLAMEQGHSPATVLGQIQNQALAAEGGN
jgi:multiple sugar transport system substrate-binding protein